MTAPRPAPAPAPARTGAAGPAPAPGAEPAAGGVGRVLGHLGRPAAMLAVVALLAWLPQYYGSTETALFGRALAFAVAALGLNILTGYNGQVSIGHGAFFGFGAYTTAILMKDHDWPFLATLPVVAAGGLVVGAAVGFPALRVKGLYLALVTLGLAALFPDLVTRFVRGTGGTTLVQIPKVTTPSWAAGFAPADDQWRYYVVLAVAVLMSLLAWNLVRGRFGRALIAVREHEAAAATVGIDLARVKVTAFALSAGFASVAGSLLVLVNGLANAGRVETFQLSIDFLVIIVIGGIGTVLGPIVGAWLFVFLEDLAKELFPGTPLMSPAIFGIALILFVYALPDGLIGGARRGVHRLRRRRSHVEPHGPDTPARPGANVA